MRVFITFWVFITSVAAFSSAYHIIDDPIEALSVRMALVKSAKKSIYSSKFIFSGDEMGLSTLVTLRQRARAIRNNGIKPDVKLLLDYVGITKLPKSIIAHLENEGIEVGIYNDLEFKKSVWNVSRHGISYLTNRMHDKLLIVDKKHALSGGRNIEDSYYSIAKKNYLDRDIYVSKEAAKTSAHHFLDMFYSKAVSSVDLSWDCAKKVKKSLFFEKLTREEEEQCTKDFEVEGKKILDDIESKLADRLKEFEIDVLGAVKKINSLDHNKTVTFVGDKIDEDGQYIAVMSLKLTEMARNARKHLLIESPYLIPSEEMLVLFKSLLNLGVKITILTNSLQSTDGIQAFAGYYKYRKRLVNLGDGENQIKLYEYMGNKELGEYLHAKSAVIDDEYALIGSYNLDPRSDKLNTEVMFMAEDTESASELSKSIYSHIKRSLPIGRNGKPMAKDKNGKFVEGSNSFPGVSNAKKMKMKLWRSGLRVPLVGPFIESQL